jgi:hypothetical protein
MEARSDVSVNKQQTTEKTCILMEVFHFCRSQRWYEKEWWKFGDGKS